MLDFVGDLNSSWRVLRQRPSHVLAAVATLALGLSASTTVFTYVNGFSQSFPGVSERRLVRLFGIEEDEPYQDLSFLDYTDYRDATQAEIAGLAAEQKGYAASVRHETMTEVAFLSAVSGDYFSVLDARMSIGRGFTLADDRPGAEQVAVLSHRWWQSSFGADPAVLGRTVYLNYRPHTIVGVASPSLPALWASGRDPLAVLKAVSDGSSDVRRGLFRHLGFGSRDALVTVQVALSIALLVVAGLILRTFASVRSLDPGFSDGQLLTIHVSTSSTNVKPEGRARHSSGSSRTPSQPSLGFAQ